MQLQDIQYGKQYLVILGEDVGLVNANYYKVIFKTDKHVVANTYWNEPEKFVPEAFIHEVDQEFITAYSTIEHLEKYIKEYYPEYFI